jgi:L-fuculose-phosphate aldolase
VSATEPDAAALGLVALGRKVVAAGVVVAAGGNLAARIPGDRILVTPMGWALDELAPEVLATVALDGSIVHADRAPTTELALHVAAMRARPDISVSVHLHPPMATLVHALGEPVRRITTDHAFYLRRLGDVPFLHPGSVELADAVAGALAGADVVLLAHHGCVVVADSFDLVFSRAVNLEAAAVATYRVLRLGRGADAPECPPEHLARVEAQEAAGFVYGRADGSGSGADSGSGSGSRSEAGSASGAGSE